MADMSVASCIRPIATKGPNGDGVTVKRRQITAIVKGVQQEGPPLIMKIAGNLQQATPKQLMKLPEGDRSKDAIVCYTEQVLRTADVQTGMLADWIVYNGRDYEVMELEDHGANGGYFRALAVRVGQ